MLMLAMMSSDATGIKSGDYTYSSNQDVFTANTFGYESGLAINIDGSVNNNPTLLELNGGKVTVVRNGEDYEFTLSIPTKVNSTISGYYKGKITNYSYTSGKKTAGRNPFAIHRLR